MVPVMEDEAGSGHSESINTYNQVPRFHTARNSALLRAVCEDWVTYKIKTPAWAGVFFNLVQCIYSVSGCCLPKVASPSKPQILLQILLCRLLRYPLRLPFSAPLKRKLDYTHFVKWYSNRSTIGFFLTRILHKRR
jgi:hypothetical protein